MTFNGYLEEINGWLEKQYPYIDLNDYEVANKINALALILAKRNNDPAPPKEECLILIDTDPEWRGFK
jgi:hypothetical protein